MPPPSRRPVSASPARRRPLGLVGLDLGPAIGSAEATAARPARQPTSNPPTSNPPASNPRSRRPAALSLSDWHDYRRRLADLPTDAPGRDQALAEADRMVHLLALLDESPAG